MQSISIHIGINEVDPTQYHGWRGSLAACENDARAMAGLAEAQGVATRISLLTRNATYARVMRELASAAAVLRQDDYLLITFAGHGASFDDIAVPGRDVDSMGDEPDRKDEAWALYDGYVLDDEVHAAFCRLAPGVRVCVVSDSCFSGTVTRDDVIVASTPRPRADRDEAPGDLKARRVEPRLANALYRRGFAETYLPRVQAVRASRRREPAAHIVLLAGCQDDQTVLEHGDHGWFTRQLLAVWNDGRFTGSHQALIDQIRCGMPARQQPQLFVTGMPSPRFTSSRPFTPQL